MPNCQEVYTQVLADFRKCCANPEDQPLYEDLIATITVANVTQNIKDMQSYSDVQVSGLVTQRTTGIIHGMIGNAHAAGVREPQLTELCTTATKIVLQFYLCLLKAARVNLPGTLQLLQRGAR